MKKIMIVEDERAISKVLSAYLKKAGFEVNAVYDGEEAVRQLTIQVPALVILDIMLPRKNGWEVLQHIRKTSSVPVIMLTAKDGIDDKLIGLNNGADDYMSKPFIPEEVVARVNAVLRRPLGWTDNEEHRRSYGCLSLDFRSQRVMLNGADVPLTPRDTSVLFFLAEHPNQTFTREQLIENIWGLDYEGSDRAVDLSIKRIRHSLSHWPKEEGDIKTLRGTGYQFWINR
ncbi:response regulator transcription factor [Paenibacillus urinalis]|uniref:Response regulator transcription factor n=1 Tax=Paenibacillus urinalis TaxID=521520 RepID=A0AAX3MZ90_9BACL|nr:MULTISPECIES: response regulator transcription factor [Paenibacillus]WDH82910.1 response regulator transcription factor [Paenibacillus urinalis]WDH98957.1 response regulator transcription factor [Paenibacillus urinalis]WDI02653.1 response regulator transcription factor [Paenibacillus urinalis]SDX81115.1 DNA-binding response regulator, OmpR family, contains REC and winged-helix (wHTH) domain [Paenibacillus sp. PDC88]GAK42935.1 hypothetical protein TCA2_5428 [Paenibacillus sp. TCA20]